MARKKIVGPLFLALALVFGFSNVTRPAIAQESAKWIVLRHDNTGYCWTALLISIEGDYRHAYAQKAGGPYDTKAEALKRVKKLEEKGACMKG